MSKYSRATHNMFNAPRHCAASGKVMFDKKGAASAVNFHWRRDHIELRTYPCRYCHAWHLTSRL